MLQYILECISFQLVFLIIYDFFLKKETFFQWNRLYLLGTHLLSLILPWIKIEAFKNEVPTEYFAYPEFLWNMDVAPITVTANEGSILNISWQQGVFFLGLLGATLLFGYKMHQLYRLRKNGDVHYFLNFTRIIVTNSNLAFSFFKSIFLGDKVLTKEHEGIIKHELVHIQQKHSWDLLFFELLRIVFWFNPLVYVYQSRISELHEFIADAHMAKTNKKEQYQLLLSQVFQTQHISFVNQFFKTSLIKKRIAMLQKSKSKKIWQLKYLLLVPMVVGMLAYTSSEAQELEIAEQEQTIDDAALVAKTRVEIEEEIAEWGSVRALALTSPQALGIMRRVNVNQVILSKEEYFKWQILSKIHYETMITQIIEKRGKTDGLSKMKDNVMSMPIPSSVRYESYVARKKAFQILDENLKYSVGAFESDVYLIDKKESYSDEFYVFEVVDVTDLTGKELRAFNNQLDEIFEKEDSDYKALILTDKQYAFEVLSVVNRSTAGTAGELKANRNKAGEDDIQPSAEPKENLLNQEDIDVPFGAIDKVPLFPGCEDAEDPKQCFQSKMLKHISKNFRYPEEAQELGIQGKVYIAFTIDENGNIANIRKRGPDKLLEKEAIRIISLLPKMKPGMHDGKEVNVPFSIPISFKLEGDDSNSTENISSYDYELLPSNIPGADLKLKKTVTNYNQLALERKRLLLKSNEKNPIIVNLDKQLRAMANQIYASGLYGFIPTPFAVVDEAPVYLGCEGEEDPRQCFQSKLQKHISKNFRYPEEAQKLEIQGRVDVKFVMDKKGNITNIKTEGPHKLLEEEVKRIISLVPNVKPGVHKGKKANVSYTIPITFKLQGESLDTKIQKLNLNGPDPLFIVDGVEFSKKELSMVRPDNIESIRVLKDAVDVEKYGKNGVVEVSTRKMDMRTMSVSAYTKIEGHKKYISGKVTDGSRGLPGVNIIIEKAKRAVVSNFDGEFAIEVQKGDVITFQYIGLPTAALKVTDQEIYLVTASK